MIDSLGSCLSPTTRDCYTRNRYVSSAFAGQTLNFSRARRCQVDFDWSMVRRKLAETPVKVGKSAFSETETIDDVEEEASTPRYCGGCAT